MAERIRCRVHNLAVRPEHRETLEDVLFTLFERRHHNFVAGQEKKWLTVELVQALRRKSRVYRNALSTETDGPLPFALGYFRLQEDQLRLTTERIPANESPKELVRLLSEFVEPGACLWFGTEEGGTGWEIRGEDDLVPLDQWPTHDRASSDDVQRC